ncbi:Protein hydE [Helicobacter heilmannii]|uniref:hypothetical protein n=1 Tax=Helicobacter heilmannii TaxID=35817 RepID=UPI0006A210F4|nr:hypothetical protein [Helicobacter heilmannii]CRF49257.1 Protein hydE [Helicobacter heilmannii]
MNTFAFKFKSAGTQGLAPLFMDFMAHHAYTKGLAYATSEEVFYLKAPPKKAEDFATELSQRLPLALGFSFMGIEVARENLKWQEQEVVCPAIDVSHAKAFLDPTHKDFLAPKAHFQSLSYNHQELDTAAKVQEAMQEALQTLQSGALVVQTSRGVISLSSTPSKEASVLFMDLASVLSVTRLEPKSAQVLCTYEKPAIRATLKEVFAKEFGCLEISALLPYDLGLALLAHFALQKGISYLFLSKTPQSPPIFTYECRAPSTSWQLYSVAQSGLMLPHTLIYAKDTPDFIQKEAPKEPHLLIYLNFTRPSCFWVYQEGGYKQLLSIEQETHPVALLTQLQSNAKGRKLYANYKEAFPDLCQSLEQTPATPPSQNLLDFLAGLLQVLGFSQEPNPRAIFELATSFLRNKGPRVDFKLTKEPLGLNTASTLKSAVSYTLGGTDAPTMCFGILDSLAEFLGNLIYDAHTKFSCPQVYLCGEVFLQKVFLDLCLQYFPKECPLIFPDYGMDYTC